jgi:hypothetical protein
MQKPKDHHLSLLRVSVSLRLEGTLAIAVVLVFVAAHLGPGVAARPSARAALTSADARYNQGVHRTTCSTAHIHPGHDR